MRTVLNILDEIAATNSPIEKQRIIRDNNSHELRLVLESAYNPYKMFFIRKVTEVKPAKKSARSLLYVRDNLLEPLSERRISGHFAMNRLLNMLSELSADDGEVLRRILKKDLRCNLGAKTINAVLPDLIPEFRVQLATGKLARATYPCIGEPKHDGMRIIAFVNGTLPSDVVFMTRGGRPVETLDNVAEELVQCFPPKTVLDGEVKSGRFQKTMSVVKRSKKNITADEKVFIIFDMLTADEFAERECERTYQERRAFLFNADVLRIMGNSLATLPSEIIRSEEEARTFYLKCLKHGHEGAMLKKLDGFYEFKRSSAWIKMKPSETVDVKITGFKEGKGKLKGSCGAITFTYKKQECSAGAMSHDEGKYLWKHRKRLLAEGALAEVEFTEETDGGKTRHARFVKLREHKGART